MDVDTIIGIICGLAMIGMLVFYHIGYNNGKYSMLREMMKNAEEALRKENTLKKENKRKQKKTPKKQK